MSLIKKTWKQMIKITYVLSTYFTNSDRKLLGQNRTNALWDKQKDDRLLTRRTGEKSRAKEKKEY